VAKSKVIVDTSEVKTLTSALESLHAQMNTDRHLNAVTKAAYEILSSEFNTKTHLMAGATAGEYHHVYEWDHVGVPGFQLWKNKLSGRGGRRSVTWAWRASRTTVPTLTTVDGEPRFGPSKGFDPSKLHRIHIFVWKAPIMEYGVAVNIRPKLGKVLVFPNPDMLANSTMGRAARPVTFTPHPVRTVPGEEVQGNFTQWFVTWWGGGVAQDILGQTFSRQRDNAFKEIFETRMQGTVGGRMRSKTFTITPDSVAARRGKNIAKAMAGDMEHHYIRMAAKRKRGNREDDDL
jgi:hypothetical protein